MVGCRSFMLQIYQAQPSLPRPICQCSGSEKDDWPSMRLLIKVTFLILSAKLFWRFRKGIASLFVILPDCGGPVLTLTFASNLELQGLITSHCLVVWSPVGKSPSLFVKNPSPPTTHWSVREGRLSGVCTDRPLWIEDHVHVSWGFFLIKLENFNELLTRTMGVF